MQKIQGKIRKALEQYNMIEDGETIAVGLSGGKDSLVLVQALASLRRYYDKKFDIIAITIDMHNGESDFSKIAEFCKNLDVRHEIVPSQIYDILFKIRKENNPCSLCARLRRAILAESAKRFGCKKLALGHHANDLIETFFLSLFYESRLSTFLPVTTMDRTGVTVIRPMILVFEKEIIRASRDMPVFYNDCPADKNTQREYVKELLNKIAPNIHQVHEHILSALTHPERNHLFKD